MGKGTKKSGGGTLVVVESPAKARTLHNYLGKGYVVKASVGHVKDLPKKELGIDIENGFAPKYITIRGKGKNLQEIRKAAEKAERVFLAPDPDREGEAIAHHLARAVEREGLPIYRVLITEITRRGVRKAFAAPGAIDRNKVAAQQARRILDRLVGYLMSPLLWMGVRRGLSAGRVQSVAMRLICEREAEIDAFVPEEYWAISATLEGKEPPPLTARLTRIDGEKAKIESGPHAQAIKEELETLPFRVREVRRTEKRFHPSPPFITSTLQQEASRRFRFTARRTMRAAQALYEGIKLGEEGPVGLITYMRTDSTRVAQEAIDELRGFISSRFPEGYLHEKVRVFKPKKGAQGAHEAIRPTSVERAPEKVEPFLTPEQAKLYGLIWKRFVATQMSPALYDVTTVEIEAGRYGFAASGSKVRFDGYRKVYGERKREEEDEEGRILPPVEEGETLRPLAIDAEQNFTKPPPRYNEATLIRELEKRGIGRPSTYASIVSVIQEREYTLKEKGRFIPTPLGRTVNRLLTRCFEDILDPAFTARMEDSLDLVEQDRLSWRNMVEEFYIRFSADLEAAKKILEEPTDVRCECGMGMVRKGGFRRQYLKCPKCGKTKDFITLSDGTPKLLEEIQPEVQCEVCGRRMGLRTGRAGIFLACAGYKEGECQNTRDVRITDGRVEILPKIKVEAKCPECGGEMVVRRSRYGAFLSCGRYPECKGKKPIPIEESCPRCGGEIFKKRARGKKRSFYACSNYPQCRFTASSLERIRSASAKAPSGGDQDAKDP